MSEPFVPTVTSILFMAYSTYSITETTKVVRKCFKERHIYIPGLQKKKKNQKKIENPLSNYIKNWKALWKVKNHSDLMIIKHKVSA